MRINFLDIVSRGIALAILLHATPGAAQWQLNGVPVCTAASHQSFPEIASDANGGATITWYDLRNGFADIYAQRLNSLGVPQWTGDGVALCTAADNQYFPTIVRDGINGAIVTWQDARSGNFDIYARRVLGNGVVQWMADGVALCTATGDQLYPAIAGDAGVSVVTWEDHRSGNADIYARRVDRDGVVHWMADGVALCTATGDQISPQITRDNSGGWIVTWEDYRNGNADIYAQRVGVSGAVQWIANGVALCTETGDQLNPAIVADFNGGAIVTWQDFRNGNFDIYAQRIDAFSGVTQWTGDGVALCTATGSQAQPDIVLAASQGAIITWQDARSGITDIYARRIDTSGVPQWTADGVALCTATGTQTNPECASDGYGGAIVTWVDNRGTYNHIYARRINASGVPEWTPDGVGLYTATGHAFRPVPLLVGAPPAAIVTWYDARNGAFDVFAQHILVSDSITTAARETPALNTLTLRQNVPNPFAATTEFEIGLPTAASVEVDVYDVAGRRVRSLSLPHEAAGWARVRFDGRNDTGQSLASGLYFYRVRAGGQSLTRKMVLIR